MASLSLRIMQIDDFYAMYLENFYRKHPSLSLKSCHEQGKKIFDDGFNAVHIIAPYINSESCNCEYFIANARYLQRAWAKEHDIAFPQGNGWVEEMIRIRVAYFKPDVIYFADPIRHDAAFIRTLPHKPKLILGWRGADIPFGTDWSGYDVMLSGLPRLLTLAESLGAKKGVMFAPGVPQWIVDAVAGIQQTVDVCFVGSISPSQHVHRRALLDFLAKASQKYGFSLNLHLSCNPDLLTPAMLDCLQQPVFGLDMHRALRRAKIVVDDRAHHGLVMPDGTKRMDLGGVDTINMRMFEATGGGSLLLTEALPGVKRYFEPGKEVDTYENETDLLEKITYYLQHENERQQIACAGQRRCLSEWNMENAVKRFLTIVEENL